MHISISRKVYIRPLSFITVALDSMQVLTMWQQSYFLLTLASLCLGNIQKWDLFATKTAYTWANNIEEPATDEHFEQRVDNKVCRAIHVNMLRRHGARYPSNGKTQEIAELYVKLIQASNELDLVDINSYGKDQASQLAPIGQQEQFGIGRRTGIRFQSLLKNHGEHVVFMSSSRTRAVDSSTQFYLGLNTTLTGLSPLVNEVNDKLIRFYDGCDNYENQVEENEAQFIEYTMFETTPEFVQVKNKLESKLNHPFTRGKIRYR